MTKPEKPHSRPERILLVLVRRPGECRGKAVRFPGGAEFRFTSVEELAGWLVEPRPPEK